jgi:hypothetical protein
VVVGLYLRLGLEDTPRFRAIEETGQIARASIAEAFSAAGVVSFLVYLTLAEAYRAELR